MLGRGAECLLIRTPNGLATFTVNNTNPHALRWAPGIVVEWGSFNMIWLGMMRRRQDSPKRAQGERRGIGCLLFIWADEKGSFYSHADLNGRQRHIIHYKQLVVGHGRRTGLSAIGRKKWWFGYAEPHFIINFGTDLISAGFLLGLFHFVLVMEVIIIIITIQNSSSSSRNICWNWKAKNLLGRERFSFMFLFASFSRVVIPPQLVLLRLSTN